MKFAPAGCRFAGFPAREVVMNKIAYSRCTDCDEQGLFMDGITCARCLGLGYIPAEDGDFEEDEEQDEVVTLPYAA
jgi:hypothetical protein